MVRYYRTLNEAVTDTSTDLVEAGLARINQHLNKGGIGIIAAATPQDSSKNRYKKLINRARELGYGPIVANGKTKDWGAEKSIIVPGITPGHLKQLGTEFKQDAVIHAPNAKQATMHYTGGDKAGTSEPLGATHYNTPNDFGITVLKGAGFSPKDDKKANRSLTFKEDITAILYPPTGMLNPFWKTIEREELSE
jgi:hypothetical protein